MSNPDDAGQSAPWAVRTARLFDGRTGHSGAPVVHLQGRRIVDVDLTGAPPASAVPVVDLGDVTLLPGLIDAHVHLSFDPDRSDHAVMAEEDRSAMFERTEHNAREYLRSGITAVRDLGDRDHVVRAVRDHHAARGAELPEILAAGSPITPHDGHAWYLGGGADSDPEVGDAVAARADSGADVVKIMATGGATTRGSRWAEYESQYPADVLRTAARTSHARDVPITAHAHGAEGITACVAAGMDGIEHGSFFTDNGAVLPDWDTVDAMAARGTFLGATEAWNPDGPPLPPQGRRRIEQRAEAFAQMHRRGVRFVCCSDSGLSLRKPHAVLPHGVIHFGADLGFTNAEALAAATSVPAQSCGLGDRKGRVAPGFDADLIAVRGNPVHDLNALLEVTTIIRDGQRITGR